MGGLQVRTQRMVLLGCAGAVTLAAWAWAVAGRHQVHHAHGMDLRTLASLTAMWLAMMVAMMTPASLEWMVTFGALSGSNRSVAAFAGGYFTVWLGYSVAAAGVQMAIAHAGWLGADGRLPARAGGVVLILAGLFYLTPLRRACLSHCSNPLTYFVARWKNGPDNSRLRGFGFGLSHGAYCVGCCWALMLTGFAVGVMSALWMAFLTLVVCVEKMAPGGERIGAVAAAGMAGWGLRMLF